MLNHIVVALDEAGVHGDHPDCTLDCAAEIAQRTGAELSMVHIEPPPPPDLEGLTPYRLEGVVAENRVDRLRGARIAREIGELQQRMTAKWTLDADAHVSTGPVRPTIERLLHSLNGDMLVARFGEEACPSRHLAALSERVMREAEIPVLFLPPSACALLHGLNRALVALDGSQQAEAILPLVRRLLPATGGTVHLLAVVPRHLHRRQGVSLVSHDGAEHYLISVARRPELRDVTIEHSVLIDMDPADAIQLAAQRTNANFVAMTTRGHSGLWRLLLGSVAHRVLEELRVPLLVWHPGAAAAGAARTALAAETALATDTAPGTTTAES